MNRFFLFVIVSTLIFATWSCGGGENPPSKETTTPKKEVTQVTDNKPNPDLGKKIYKQYCALCHGKDGKLGVNGAGDLTASAIPEEEVMTRIKKGKGLMTPFEEILSETQIEAVTKFVMEMRSGE